MSYWERLQYLKMYSIECRFECYKIILTLKHLEGLVPDCGIRGVVRPYIGRICEIPAATGRRPHIWTLRAASFQIAGPSLFNHLPQYLRNLSKCDHLTFKLHLDHHLQEIPDLPYVAGGEYPPPLDQFTEQNSNSVKDWSQYLNLVPRRTLVEQSTTHPSFD